MPKRCRSKGRFGVAPDHGQRLCPAGLGAMSQQVSRKTIDEWSADI